MYPKYETPYEILDHMAKKGKKGLKKIQVDFGTTVWVVVFDRFLTRPTCSYNEFKSIIYQWAMSDGKTVVEMFDQL